MHKRGFYWTTLLSFFCFGICYPNVIINGVSNICQNPDGRLGRCTTLIKCHNYNGCDRNASTKECANGFGELPYVCCIFGKTIVFPDDDDGVRFMSAAAESSSSSSSNSKSPPTVGFRSTATSSPSRGILFPDENGNFNIPVVGDRWADKREEPKNKMKLFPTPPVCGPMLVGDKIHGGVEAQLGEFPWLVNLEYENEDGDIQIGCAGNILNNRYVLTAAHCVKGPIEELLGNLVSMRVGDHNTDTDNDCDDLGCIDRFIRYYIIEKIVHKDFRAFKRGRLINDIALLKTDNEMIYSFSVAPICLPNIQQALHPPVNGSTLTVAGWGDNGIEDFSVEKRIVDVPYIDNSVCPLRLLPTQICAGGVKGKDSCVGDSGGSLARRSTGGWIIEGMVSYGRNCGSDTPAVYTRVRSFLPWIMDHVNDS